MLNELSSLPLSLRQENFGGILFDPVDATFIEMDEEGYEVVAEYALDGSPPRNAAAADFLREIRTTLGSFDGRPIRFVGQQNRPVEANVPVLAGPTLVDFQITNKCHLDCPHCYASSTSAGAHGSWEDISLALDQIAEVGAFQLAIGGGEPLLHPRIGDILARCHELGIVPNLTTSGLNLKSDTLELLAKYCGAVGVSLEGIGEEFDQYRKTGFTRFEHTVDKLQEYGVPVVLQVAVNVETLDRLDKITDYVLTRQGIYGVIFLAFKPVGRGAVFGQTLGQLPHSEVHTKLTRAFERLSVVTRVGFDCCLTPAVTGLSAGYDSHAAAYLEGCSALRASLGISPQLDVMPCTFTAKHSVGNMKEHHLRDIWKSANTARFRSYFDLRKANNSACGSCPKHGYCLGGCPVMDLVNCDRDYLANHTT